MNTRKKSTKKKTVFVGLSGGVDSSVSAALLQEAGYIVVGVFIKVWQPDFIECTWRDERRDAMRVAAHLGIPFLTMDLQDEYKKGVADYMISEYKAGRTPNPDVMCNKEVKFGAFFQKARAMGADFVATGHYARNHFDAKKGKWLLEKGLDGEKDQSYFLWTLTQEKLAHVLFPVGHFQKKHVRALAKRFGLPTEQKKDSQGVCFLGKLDMKDFLKHYIKTKKGAVLDTAGTVIGTHDGAVFYTIGERHGFSITQKTPDDAPLYIVSKDIKKNTITVAKQQTKMVSHSKNLQEANEIQIEKCNWILDEAPVLGKTITARLRYRQELAPCIIATVVQNYVVVRFHSAQPTASSGQSAVFYDGATCLGGGVIV